MPMSVLSILMGRELCVLGELHVSWSFVAHVAHWCGVIRVHRKWWERNGLSRLGLWLKGEERGSRCKSALGIVDFKAVD